MSERKVSDALTSAAKAARPSAGGSASRITGRRVGWGVTGAAFLIDVIHWLCVGRGETVEEYLPMAEQEEGQRQAEADADTERIRFSNEHDCLWFPDGTRGGLFRTPRDVVVFYNAYGDPNWRDNLIEKPWTSEDEERD